MDHIEGQVVFGDTKAGLLLTTDSILLAALGVAVNGVDVDSLALATRIGIAASATLLGVGLVLGLLTFMPSRRHFRGWPGAGPPLPGELLLFSSIAQLPDADTYVRLAADATADDLGDDVLRAVYGKSRWALRKYKYLWLAVSATITSVALAAAAAVVETASRIL